MSWLDAAKPLLTAAFTLWGSPVTWLEIVACVLSVWMVVCNMRVNPLGWPLAMISSLLYFALFWNSKLYGDASLQIFFALVALWGWRQWLRGTDPQGAKLQVRYLAPATRTALITGRYQYRLPVGLEEPVAFRDVGLPPVKRVFSQWLHSATIVLGLFPDWFGPPQPVLFFNIL